MPEQVVIVEGRLSIREDETPTIIATTISRLGENKTKTIKINIDNLSDDEVLMVGSSVRTDIILNEHKNVFSIPISCLNSSDLLYSVKNGVVVSEETGDLIMDENYVMVQSNKRNTEFVIRGQNRIFPGQRVKTTDYKDSQHE